MPYTLGGSPNKYCEHIYFVPVTAVILAIVVLVVTVIFVVVVGVGVVVALVMVAVVDAVPGWMTEREWWSAKSE